VTRNGSGVAAPIVPGTSEGAVAGAVAVVFLAGTYDLTELGTLVTEAAVVRAALG
jgi:hypothetical protein